LICINKFTHSNRFAILMHMSDRIIEYRGALMLESWPDEIKAAQKQTSYTINGQSRHRVPYCSETGTTWERPLNCRDCKVQVGELHVPGCLIEECPVCEDQAWGCDCENQDRENCKSQKIC